MYRHLKKIVPLFLVLVLVLVPFTVYASESSYFVEELPILPRHEDCPNAYVFKHFSGSYEVYLFSNDVLNFSHDTYNDTQSYSVHFDKCYRYRLTDGEWVLVYEKTNFNHHFDFEHYGYSDFEQAKKDIILRTVYSDVSLYDVSSKFYFFYVTPRTIMLSSGLSTQAITNLVLTQVVSLIPSLISFLVLVVGLFKAYRLLRQALVGA